MINQAEGKIMRHPSDMYRIAEAVKKTKSLKIQGLLKRAQ
jgi:hypothetical protein